MFYVTAFLTPICVSVPISLSPYIPASFLSVPLFLPCPFHLSVYLSVPKLLCFFITISDYLFLSFRPYFLVSVSLYPCSHFSIPLFPYLSLFIYFFIKILFCFFLLISLCLLLASLDNLDWNWSGR